MAADSPPKTPILEALGARYLSRLAGSQNVLTPIDEVHILNAGERASLLKIERGVIVRAAIAGALSAVAAAIAVYLADPLLGDESANSANDPWAYWAIVGGTAIVATGIELAFLYWDSLRTVNRMAEAAGLQLMPSDSEQGQANPVLNALVRAALELPSPRTHDVLEPGRELSKLRVLVAAVVYKAKITVTNFLLKAIVRRLMGRVIVRAWLEFVAVPATALWNALVCRWVIREARIRVMGPSAVREFVENQLSDAAVSPAAKPVAVRAIGSVISRNAELHPNLECLFAECLSRVDMDGEADVCDSPVFTERPKALDEVDATFVLRVLQVGLVIDGHATRQELQLLAAAQESCGQKPDVDGVKRLIHRFAAGNGLEPDVLETSL